jgi:glycerol-3-phosphate dehydrogenase
VPDAYDVVVIGGGIHGVGVAQAAAAGGHDVLLLEKSDLAAGTSSRSSKLIHGGLRYLEGGHLRLVRECLRERELLLRLAPGLVHRCDFHLPIFRTTRRRPWQIRAGLSLYAILAGLRPEVRFRALRRAEWQDLDGLSTDGLQAVYRYTDAQTDDAALTRAVMRSAQQLGAHLVSPGRFDHATLDEDTCEIVYSHDGATLACTARVLVNAAGPWANEVLAHIDPAPAARTVELVQGAHIVVPGKIERGVYYLESPRDGRAVFVIPWHDRTLVGTTETIYRGHPDDVHPYEEEQAYLLEVLQHHFPRAVSVRDEDIQSSFAGLRVLPAAEGGLSRRSRETILDVDRPRRARVLTIYGGKLTAYRATAEKVMRKLARSLPARPRRADTRTLPLTPSD